MTEEQRWMVDAMMKQAQNDYEESQRQRRFLLFVVIALTVATAFSLALVFIF